MRARRLPARKGPPCESRRLSTAALIFLRGRDADGRLRELAAGGRATRPVLGALAGALISRRGPEALGYRSLGDYGRERLGLGARVLREWARVGGRLAELPRLRAAVLSGEVGWTVARKVVGLATPESEAEGFVAVRVACTEREAGMWHAALERARRVAGEALPVWACAEAIAAEAASAGGGGRGERPAGTARGHTPGTRPRRFGRARPAPSRVAASSLAALALRPVRRGRGAGAGPRGMPRPREVDRRLRAATAFLQRLDLETGRVLRQVLERRLYRELGFASFERYAQERLDLAPRTARRLVALARAEARAPAVAEALHKGVIHAFQARALLAVARPGSERRWVARARAVTLRRLEADVAASGPRAAVAFRAPEAVARLFLAMLKRAGSLERLLAQAIAAWTEQGSQFRDYADFERDGWRCLVPGCTARRGLESHHIRFRSAGGPDVPANRATLCAFHHHRGVHAGRVRLGGTAPDRLVFELTATGERYRSGDVRLAIGVTRR